MSKFAHLQNCNLTTEEKQRRQIWEQTLAELVVKELKLLEKKSLMQVRHRIQETILARVASKEEEQLDEAELEELALAKREELGKLPLQKEMSHHALLVKMLEPQEKLKVVEEVDELVVAQ